jgi:hypothetical protein
MSRAPGRGEFSRDCAETGKRRDAIVSPVARYFEIWMEPSFRIAMSLDKIFKKKEN